MWRSAVVTVSVLAVLLVALAATGNTGGPRACTWSMPVGTLPPGWSPPPVGATCDDRGRIVSVP